MQSSEIRENFLKYFEGKGHKILPGSSLVPKDPTVLLTLAGMLQFKPIFLGQEKPSYKRATTVQKCLRTNDIEQVGKTARHHTFFEMLGNFSFGDYFKTEAIEFAWEFLTVNLKLPKERLLIAVFEKDDEAYDIWKKKMDIPPDRIFRLGEDNNFWAAGPTGPCGPCSEIYYDLGPGKGCGQPDCQPGCDCDRFLEIWNLVFIQYNRDGSGQLIPLKQRGIDTGMGLERITAVIQKVDSNFDTDLFKQLIDDIKPLINPHPLIPVSEQVSLRIIADHARAATHLISDGVIPDNSGRGYILRRLIRRAIRHAKLLGGVIHPPFLSTLARSVIDQMKKVYPVLSEKRNLIIEILDREENNFWETLDQGMKIFQEVIAQHMQDKIIPGSIVFKLHDTFGFPIELSREIASEAGFKLDEAGFQKAMKAQRDRGRQAGIAGEKQKLLSLALEHINSTKFVGYEKTTDEGKVLVAVPGQNLIILDKTPFYGESGGQAGDTGLLSLGETEVRVVDTLITPKGVIVHEVDKLAGLKEGKKVKAIVDAAKRQATAKHHTATHLLHKALREVLGGHIKQAGSYVGPDKLRFDFSHFAAISRDDLIKVETLVNQKIHEKIKIETLQKDYQDALKLGATALFNEKYGDQVRVVRIDNFSLELCGGTHVQSTGELLFFKIINESALGAGVRRIEALAGQAAKVQVIYQAKSLRDEIEKLINHYRLVELEKENLGGEKFTETNIFQIELTELDRLSSAVDGQDAINVNKIFDHLTGRLEWLRERLTKSEKELRDLKLKSASQQAGDFLGEVLEIKGVKVLTKEFKTYSMDMLRSVSDTLQRQLKSCVLVFASNLHDRLIFLITVSPDLMAKGYSAQTLAATFSSVTGGKGGGKANSASGGGNDPSKIPEALDKVRKQLAI
ncbi:alanine--tRNA ligase [Candidatus Saganbacteria bacterium]|nr:alanine--tRNA ligase [Candidatus Saganbacteria bacterium]